jgi:hypothetical protein
VKFLAINGDLVKGGDYVNIYSFGGDLVNYLTYFSTVCTRPSLYGVLWSTRVLVSRLRYFSLLTTSTYYRYWYVQDSTVPGTLVLVYWILVYRISRILHTHTLVPAEAGTGLDWINVSPVIPVIPVSPVLVVFF